MENEQINVCIDVLLKEANVYLVIVLADFDPRLRSTEAAGARRAQEATSGEGVGKCGEGRRSAEDG